MTLGVIGAGLIGRSVTLAARRVDPRLRVLEFDRGDALDAARDCTVIVLAAPVDAILDILNTGAGHLRHAVTLDTGSTKRAIVRAATANGLTRFVGGHPMAGAATSGAASARADLFDGRPWFLVRGASTAEAFAQARAFVTTLGARPVALEDDGDEHDRVMAAVSHAPQLTASALMTVVASAAGDRLGWAGPGLRDTTRLADSGRAMWDSIFASNADAIVPVLRNLARVIDESADRLSRGEAVGDLLDSAQRARALL